MTNRPFYFNKAASRIVTFSMSQFSLHNFSTDEWVITIGTGNQWGEWGQSYLLSSKENLGDPRCEDFIDKLRNLISVIKNDFAANEYRRVTPEVCDLSIPNFKNGELFINYRVGEQQGE